MEALKQGSDALFILLGGIMVLAMHAGFAFLELGTVRKKNQVNALVKSRSCRIERTSAQTSSRIESGDSGEKCALSMVSQLRYLSSSF